MTSTIQQAIDKLETAIGGFLKDTVEPALEAEWAIVKPQVLGLGETVLAQVWQAALVYVTSGGNYAAALASITAQLPADLAALEHVAAAALSAAIASLQAKQAAGQPVQ